MFSLFRRTPTMLYPTIGFFDLSKRAAHSELTEDKAVIAPLFCSTSESSTDLPKCDVLFIYCRIRDDGSLDSYPRSLREIIRYSGATIVVVATANSTAAYITAGRKQKYGAANLVMTLDRKGSSFSNFFQSLFTQMRNGASMPTAWAKLAPQGPSALHAHCPDTMFACELGQVAFK